MKRESWRWAERGELIAGPLAVAGVVIAAFISPRLVSSPEGPQDYYAAVLMLGVAAAMAAWGSFLVERGAPRPLRLLLPGAVGPVTGYFLARVLLFPAGGLLYGGEYIYLTAWVLCTLLAGLFLEILLRGVRTLWNGRPFLSGAAVIAGIALLILPVAKAWEYRPSAVSLAEGYGVSLLYTAGAHPGGTLDGGEDRLYLIGPGEARCLEAATGRQLWTTELDPLFGPHLSPLAGKYIHAGTVLVHPAYYLQAAGGEAVTVAAFLDALTGEPSGKVVLEIPEYFGTGPVNLHYFTGSGEIIWFNLYEADGDGRSLLLAVNLDGRILWERPTEIPFSRPNLLGDALLVQQGAEMWCLEAATGLLRWSCYTGSNGYGYAYVPPLIAVSGLELSGFEADSGALRWQRSLPRNAAGTVAFVAALIQSGGHVVAAFSDGSLAALDSASGEILWEKVVEVGSRNLSLFPAGESLFFCGTARGGLYLVEAETGALLWRFRGDEFETPQYLIAREGLIHYLAGNRLYTLEETRPAPATANN